MRNTCSDADSSTPSRTLSSSRRQFLSRAGKATATALSVGAVGLPSLSLLGTEIADAAEIGPTNGSQRANQAYQIRHKAALFQKGLPAADHPTNGDDDLYSNRIGSYSKGLPHNGLGEVDLYAYNTLINALTTGDPADFERIPRGGVVKQVDPQAALAFELEGADSHHLGIAVPPAFSSAETAGEMAELYWQALTRDVPFSEYDTHPLTVAAAADLTSYSDFRGPKISNQVTATTLFRGHTAGDLVGPYVSQFLWKDVPYGATPIVQRIRSTVAGIDYMTTYAEWLAVQNGAAAGPNQFDSTPRYIRTGRDLGEYVHIDFSYQAFLNAGLILLGMRAPLDAGNPYRKSTTQAAFSTFGGPHLLDLVARVANCALKAAWYQKWSVHRRLRPEAFGGRIHNQKTGAANYPINAEILNSPVLNEVYSRYGTYLLPQAFPEGSPTHPAYPAGHATIAGACATVLKAFFDEYFVLRNPVEASPDGLSLLPYAGGSDLTVGGELNKLAANIALGRNAAGVHWRSDGTEGLKLGEAVAISILTDMKGCFNEHFDGFSLTKFDGMTVTI